MTVIIVHTDEGRITCEGGRVVAEASKPANIELDARGAQVEPGDVNAHTHIYSGLAPLGMPPPKVPPENFVQILERVWWPLDRALDEATLRASARLYIAESLLAGASTLIDHHESPNFIDGALDVIADAAAELGIRTYLCYGITERNGGLEEARRGLAECVRYMKNARPLSRGTIGIHASFTVSDEAIKEAANLARAHHTGLHVHVAEDGADVEDAKARGYGGVIDRFEKLNAMVPGSIFAHGVHLTPDEVARAEHFGCWFVQNPRSNQGNKVGYPKALVRSNQVALGTDGFPARMDEEGAALEAASQAAGEPPAVAGARRAAGHALASQRLALNLGTLEPGSTADLVVRRDGAVQHVIVEGELVVQDGVLRRADIETIRAQAQEAANVLWPKMEAYRS